MPWSVFVTDKSIRTIDLDAAAKRRRGNALSITVGVSLQRTGIVNSMPSTLTERRPAKACSCLQGCR